MDDRLIMEYGRIAKDPGEAPACQGVGRTVEPGCGDVMTIYFSAEREIITSMDCTITESACWPVRACGGAAISLARGKPVMEAYLITADQIGDLLGGLPKEQRHCALMAELTLKRSIRDYAEKKSRPAREGLQTGLSV